MRSCAHHPPDPSPSILTHCATRARIGPAFPETSHADRIPRDRIRAVCRLGAGTIAFVSSMPLPGGSPASSIHSGVGSSRSAAERTLADNRPTIQVTPSACVTDAGRLSSIAQGKQVSAATLVTQAWRVNEAGLPPLGGEAGAHPTWIEPRGVILTGDGSPRGPSPPVRSRT